MTPERWVQIRQIFEGALDRPEGDRAAYLRITCARDEELRRDVEGLLASHEDSADFLNKPAAEVGRGQFNVTQFGTQIAAGAQFLVAPGLNAELVQAAQLAGITMLPGVFTASEVDLALRLGTDLLKLFPAELSGPAYLAALLQPFPAARLVPTGGIGPENAGAYLKAGAVAVAMGSSLFPARRIMSEGPEVVAALVERALAAVTREVTR